MSDTHLYEQASAFWPRAMEWWRGARHRWKQMAELQSLDSHELAIMAGELGMSPGELMKFAQEPEFMPELLLRRLAALHLSEADVGKLSPLLLADLKRTCCGCSDKARCSADMAINPLAPGWESYCPNSGTLNSL